MIVTRVLNRILPLAWLRERDGDSEYSRFAWPRWVNYSHDEERWHIHSTRAEFQAWFKENCPNGRCICYPERGIVCGQHDPRYAHATPQAGEQEQP